MSKAFRVLALNTWQFFEYHDSFGMTILDYALTNSEPINQGSAVLDNIFREAARIQAIAIYSSSYVVARASTARASATSRSSRCYFTGITDSQMWKSRILFAPWKLTRLYATRLHSEPGQLLDSMVDPESENCKIIYPSRRTLRHHIGWGRLITMEFCQLWATTLPRYDCEILSTSVIVRIFDRHSFLQKESLLPYQFRLLDEQGGFCFSWPPNAFFALLKNHVTFATDFSRLGAPFTPGWWERSQQQCPFFSGPYSLACTL
jgi:hypothetical protein